MSTDTWRFVSATSRGGGQTDARQPCASVPPAKKVSPVFFRKCGERKRGAEAATETPTPSTNNATNNSIAYARSAICAPRTELTAKNTTRATTGSRRGVPPERPRVRAPPMCRPRPSLRQPTRRPPSTRWPPHPLRGLQCPCNPRKEEVNAKGQVLKYSGKSSPSPIRTQYMAPETSCGSLARLSATGLPCVRVLRAPLCMS